ncbi:hypothetical protein ACLOJK_034843, partial [Asimina triloba]
MLVVLFVAVDGEEMHGGDGRRVLAATGGICWRPRAAWRAATACLPAVVVAAMAATQLVKVMEHLWCSMFMLVGAWWTCT